MSGFVFNDGGRAAAGYRGTTGDCVVRAAAIITGKPYQEIYETVNLLGRGERITKNKKSRSNARTGVYKETTRKLIESLGGEWVPLMKIGSGCKCRLGDGNLPGGRLIVSLSRHVSAVIDGVIHDNHDPRRYVMDDTGKTRPSRCVYGYWRFS